MYSDKHWIPICSLTPQTEFCFYWFTKHLPMVRLNINDLSKESQQKLFTSLFQNVAKYQIRNIIFLKYIWPVNKIVDLPKLISSTNVLKWKHVSLTVNDAQMPWHYKWHIWMPVYIPFVNIMQWGGKRKSIVKVLFFFNLIL